MPVGAAAALPPNTALSLTVHRCQTAQFNVRDEAMKYHSETDASKKRTDWDSIRADRLLDDSQCGDFAKLFVTSHSKKDVDLFESLENGELMFLILMFCKEFRDFSSFFSSDAQRHAFHQSVGSAIQDIYRFARSCQGSRSDLAHGFEKMETPAGSDMQDCKDIEQKMFQNVTSFLSAIVAVSQELARLGLADAELASSVSTCLDELQGLAGKKC